MEYSQFEFWGILPTNCPGDYLRTPGFLAAESVTRSKRCDHFVGDGGGAGGVSAFLMAVANSSALAEGENGD